MVPSCDDELSSFKEATWFSLPMCVDRTLLHCIIGCPFSWEAKQRIADNFPSRFGTFSAPKDWLSRRRPRISAHRHDIWHPWSTWPNFSMVAYTFNDIFSFQRIHKLKVSLPFSLPYTRHSLHCQGVTMYQNRVDWWIKKRWYTGRASLLYRGMLRCLSWNPLDAPTGYECIIVTVCRTNLPQVVTIWNRPLQKKDSFWLSITFHIKGCCCCLQLKSLLNARS